MCLAFSRSQILCSSQAETFQTSLLMAPTNWDGICHWVTLWYGIAKWALNADVSLQHKDLWVWQLISCHVITGRDNSLVQHCVLLSYLICVNAMLSHDTMWDQLNVIKPVQKTVQQKVSNDGNGNHVSRDVSLTISVAWFSCHLILSFWSWSRYLDRGRFNKVIQHRLRNKSRMVLEWQVVCQFINGCFLRCWQPRVRSTGSPSMKSDAALAIWQLLQLGSSSCRLVSNDVPSKAQWLYSADDSGILTISLRVSNIT